MSQSIPSGSGAPEGPSSQPIAPASQPSTSLNGTPPLTGPVSPSTDTNIASLLVSTLRSSCDNSQLWPMHRGPLICYRLSRLSLSRQRQCPLVQYLLRHRAISLATWPAAGSTAHLVCHQVGTHNQQATHINYFNVQLLLSGSETGRLPFARASKWRFRLVRMAMISRDSILLKLSYNESRNHIT
jgi:hypothetical protein